MRTSVLVIAMALLGACGKESQFGGNSQLKTGLKTSGKPGGELFPGTGNGSPGEWGPLGSPNGNPPPGGKTGHHFSFVCPSNPLYGSVNRNISVEGSKPGIFHGEICLTQPVSHTIADFVFVMDTSGSMSTSDPNCKRREAVQAVLSKISGSMRDGDDIRVGLVKFNSSASIVSSLESVADATARVSSDEFCKKDKKTNYEAAFKRVREVISGSGERQKIVYFLSDGMPTEDDSSGNEADNGLKSANAVHALGNVRILSIFLFGTGEVVEVHKEEAKRYLAEISHGEENVRLVEGADSLVSEILKFELPAAPSLVPGDIELTLSLPGQASEVIPIESVQANDTNPLAWNFVSAPFAFRRGTPAVHSFGIKLVKAGVTHDPVNEVLNVHLP